VNGLYALKPWYTRRLQLFTDAAVARQLSPDVFTAIGVLAALGAAGALAAGWWLPAGLLLAARLAGANLDGAVARARGVSRPWGFVLNEIGDRASDFLMFAGLAAFAARTPGAVPAIYDSSAHLLTAGLVVVLVAALAGTLPTFASLAAAGAGASRRNGGPLGKTERCALVVVAVAVPAVLAWVCLLLTVGSVLTAALRLRATHTELAAADRPAGPVATSTTP
jgi:CDP-diacylglycerol---glycerol-3-phosphate 3-phosphatidyltransferase